MTGIGLMLSVIFVPEITNPSPTKAKPTLLSTLSTFNPLRILRQFIYPNIFFAVSLLPTSPTYTN